MSTGILNQSLIEAIKANDEKILKTLYDENYPKVSLYVVKNNGTEEQAMDIFQEAFIAMWRNIQSGKFRMVENASINAYLFRIATNKWLDYLRSSAFKNTTALKDHHQDLMTFEDLNDTDTERIALIRKNFEKLGDTCRDLLTRFYYRKQALKEIAGTMNITEATAKNNKYRCMEQLRALTNFK